MRPTLAPQLQEPEPEGQAVKSQQHQQREHQHERVCDYCNESTALLYCRADSAKLCFSCDREVHTANQLFSKHSRSLLCDRCDKSAASIFCETEHSVLCQNCDWESHNLSLSSVHNRRAIEGFTGCPSVTQLLTIVGFDDLGNKALFLNEEIDNNCELMESGLDQFPDFLLWETPAIGSLDDLIVASDSAHNFRAMDVPPLPKNRNAAYGQHKEEMLSQLRELAKSEPNLSYGNAETEPSFEFELLVKEKNTEQPHTFIGSDHVGEQMPFPACETSGFQSLGYGGEALDQDFVPSLFKSYVEETSKVSDKQLDIRGSVSHANDDDDGESQHLFITNTLPVFPKMAHHELNSQERETAISRYKEKKKTRRYDKHIRYESRKVRAESRTRIKGRFAKT